jgi:hypothetical protein
VAGVPGPYVLGGHSIAGFNVQLFARESAGDTVVGVVIIDARSADIANTITAVPGSARVPPWCGC